MYRSLRGRPYEALSVRTKQSHEDFVLLPFVYVFVTFLNIVVNWTPAVAATLPPGFTESVVTNELSNPTAMAFAPDGRLFVCEQTGALRVIKNGVLLPTPFVSLTVNAEGERGLLGVAFDPNFAANQFVYVYYTATSPSIHNRVSRFTANGDVAVSGSEVQILNLETLNETNHNGGAIHFGGDGKLYVATGENANPAFAQSVANRLGKLLRINADGSIPADNPTTFKVVNNGVESTVTPTGVNRAIWALGLRNPFSFAVQPGTGDIFINDVGQVSWEEINEGIRGANYGWPETEGETSDSRFTSPLYAYSHSQGCAIVGGAFYNPPVVKFPGEYVGKYFFADLCQGWIRRYDPISDSVKDFATGITNPVDLQVGADGNLYYLARGSNLVVRVQFVANRRAANDYEDDGKTDIAVWRSAAGTWFILTSSSNYTSYISKGWGNTGDIPVPGDYDGDGKTDMAMWRSAAGTWFILTSSSNYTSYISKGWGNTGDIPVPGDYDGDGKTDIAVWRPAAGVWFILTSSSNFVSSITKSWGGTGDIPVASDYDGDGKTDMAVWRRTAGTWFVLTSSSNYTSSFSKGWGNTNDVAVPGDYDGDGKTDMAMWRPAAGVWFILTSSSNYTSYISKGWGNTNDVTVPGDYDGDGKTDMAMWRPTAGTWFILTSSSNYTSYISKGWGNNGDIPVVDQLAILRLLGLVP